MTQSTQNQEQQLFDTLLDSAQQLISIKVSGYADRVGVPVAWIERLLGSVLKPDAIHMDSILQLALVILQSGDGLIAQSLRNALKELGPLEQELFVKTTDPLLPHQNQLKNYYDFYAAAVGYPEIIGQPDNRLVGTDMLLSDLEADPEYSGDYQDEGYITVGDFKEYIRSTVPEEMHQIVFANAG